MVCVQPKLIASAFRFSVDIDVSKKKIDKIKIVVNGAGASAMACTNLFKKSGVPQKNITMVDLNCLKVKMRLLLLVVLI